MRLLLVAAVLLVAPSSGWAHAFPDHSDPRVGHALDASPPAVRIWFDGAIEPVFSTIRVESADQQRVDKGDARVDPTDPTLLQVSLPPLPWSCWWGSAQRTTLKIEFGVGHRLCR